MSPTEDLPEPLFMPSDAPFWSDPWIGARLVQAHLDQHHEAASRPAAVLDSTVAHLAGRGLVGPGVRVLDLGCGPGLVSHRLAAQGCRVTGLDVNPHSLGHARRTAAEAGLDIDYREQDLMSLADRAAFDLALQSYGELSTFAPEALDDLLARVHRALVPGGAFVFDLTTPAAHPPRPDTERTEQGFWRPGAYRVRETRRHVGPVCCDRYEVTDDSGTTTYRMWFHDHTPDSVRPVLEHAGFRVVEVWGSLAGQEPDPAGAWFAVLARR